MVVIYQGGSTGLVQQNKRVFRKDKASNTDIGIQRQIKDTLKAKFEFDIVIMHFGGSFIIIEEDAEYFNKEFKFKLIQPGRYTYHICRIPLTARQKYIDLLKGEDKEFCLLDQYQVDDKEEFYRVVNISTNEKALGFTFLK
tara:strand:- start:8 stop:430 length:423 start_codon:yes stop_codon:yes gene_type:complete